MENLIIFSPEILKFSYASVFNYRFFDNFLENFGSNSYFGDVSVIVRTNFSLEWHNIFTFITFGKNVFF